MTIRRSLTRIKDAKNAQDIAGRHEVSNDFGPVEVVSSERYKPELVKPVSPASPKRPEAWASVWVLLFLRKLENTSGYYHDL